MASPLRFDGETLELLDQTRLPDEEAWIRCRDANAVAAAIARLAVRGAPAIGIAAAYGVVLAVRESGETEFRARFDEAHATLLATRPTAVNLRWALEGARSAIEAADGRDSAYERLLAFARRLERDQQDADRRIALAGAELFTAGDRVLTHCNAGALATGGAGTAGAVIEAAWRAGRLAHVWVDETRPLLQGARLTAWELGHAGIPYEVVTDASVGTLMARGLVDRVVVGADRIAANGDVANKIGTYTAAVLSARHGVPFYVAAPLSTIDPETPTGDDIPIEERDPSEVTHLLDRRVAPPDAPAANWAFDVTPSELVAAIITDRGVLSQPYDAAIARVCADAAPGRDAAPAAAARERNA